MGIAVFLLSIVKAAPAVESIAAQFVAMYVAWKTNQNIASENKNDSRNDAAVDAATAGLPKLCGSCPFAQYSGGQHGSDPSRPSVPGDGPGSS